MIRSLTPSRHESPGGHTKLIIGVSNPFLSPAATSVSGGPSFGVGVGPSVAGAGVSVAGGAVIGAGVAVTTATSDGLAPAPPSPSIFGSTRTAAIAATSSPAAGLIQPGMIARCSSVAGTWNEPAVGSSIWTAKGTRLAATHPERGLRLDACADRRRAAGLEAGALRQDLEVEEPVRIARLDR